MKATSPRFHLSFLPGARTSRLLLAASMLASLAPAGCDDVSDDPSTLRNAAGTVDPATGGGGAAGGFEPSETAPNPNFFCPYRYTPEPQNATALPLPFPYCATANLDPDTRYDFDAVTRLVISQHGRGSNAHMYFDRLTDAATALAPELRGSTFVIAPQFFDMKPINNDTIHEWELDGLLWWQDGSWPNGLPSNGHNGESFSSYTIMDGLVDKAVSQMPNLREVIFVGQSAGGQTVQKYAVLNNATYPASVNVRYLPANPYVYAYVDEQRSTFEFGQDSPDSHIFEEPDPNNAFPWEAPLVCSALVGTARPDHYDDWAGGLQDTPGYSGVLNPAQQQGVRDRYLDRDVTYLIGENDMFTDSDQCNSGVVQIQGKHRRRRAEAYAAHVQQLGAEHELVKVPDFGHGSTMFEEDCVRRVIFGLGDDCDAMEDEQALASWDGEIIEVAAFEADDGDDLPEVIVAHRGDNGDKLYLLDDVDQGFAFIADITPQWGPDAQVTALETQYVVPNAPGREAIVGVSGGAGGLYVLGTDNGSAIELEALGQGQDVAALTTANISAHSGTEIVVAWDADEGERWRTFAWDGNVHIPTLSGTYEGDARPVAIEVSNFVFDNTREIAIALDSTTGARLVLAHPLGNTIMVDPGWADGRRIVDADHSTALGAEEQNTAELVLATAGGGEPWVVLEEDPDAEGTLIQVLESPDTWPGGVEPTSITVGSPSWGKSTVAVGRTGPIDGHAVMYTHKRDDGVVVLGDVRIDALGLGDDARIPRIEFADLDDRGTREVLIGRSGDLSLGYRLRALSAL